MLLPRIIHERRLVVDKIKQFQELDAQERFLRAFHNLIQERVWNQRFKPESARLMNNPGYVIPDYCGIVVLSVR
jgi:hypothetical protein